MSIRLSFGTAGIRAALGPGLDQINAFTVGGVAHALCSYLVETQPGALTRGVCVAFDGRTDSDLFAREVVRVARLHGLLVRAFESPTPTPLLAFATRFHRAAAGVIVTASHNPPGDNGLKIYLAGGAQVLAPHDRAIAARIQTFEPAQLDALADNQLGGYEALGPREVTAYLDQVSKLVALSSTPLPRLAYSALCGVGGAVTRQLLVRAGARDVLEVEGQAEPRADFGGLSSPNPEHPSALAQLLALADREHVELAFAHDPDADRLAVVVRDRKGALRILSGDQVGALLGDFVLGETADPARALLVSTLVSGELLEHIALAKGARFERTPTGFKWIASRARQLETSEGLRFVFGYEEAIGYAFGSMADDKDGIAALHVLLECARRLHATGSSLSARLDQLARTHGLFVTRQLTVPRGTTSADTPDQLDLMARLRTIDPASLLGPGSTRCDHSLLTHGAPARFGATAAQPTDLLVFRRPAGSRVCVRPSGTEPKLKLYLHARSTVGDGALALDQAEREAARELDELEARLRTV
jgi:phosphomannomutase